MSSFTLIVILFVAFIAWLLWSWRRDVIEVDADAHARYGDVTAQDDHPMRDLSRNEFVALYRRVHGVRRPVYALIFFAIAALGTVPTLMLMSIARKYFYYGPIVWGFEVFFSLIAWWVAAFAITLKIYHSRKPGALDEEFRRLKS